MTDRILVGHFSGGYGLDGEVRLKSFCATPEAIADYTPLTTTDGTEFAQIVLTGRHKNTLTVRVNNVVTKEQADALRGVDLYATRDQLPSLPDDEFYHTDLIGLEVFDTGGTRIGMVKDVLNNGADDLLEVTSAKHSDTLLIPFTKTGVPTVDLTARRIIADPPEGVL